MPNKPQSFEVCADTVPAELKALRQWVCWRHILKDGDRAKIPFRASGEHAKTNTPDTWTTFSTALNAYRHRKAFDGIGFVFSENDLYCEIDLDSYFKPDQTPKRWATKIMAELTPVGYGEISPSGNGVKYWTWATFGVGCNTSTGDGQETVNWILETSFSTQEKSAPAPGNASGHPFQSTDEIIDRIRQSAQSDRFDKLFRSDWSDYRSGNEGTSRADQALFSIIAQLV